jgi:hypothetical protein
MQKVLLHRQPSLLHGSAFRLFVVSTQHHRPIQLVALRRYGHIMKNTCGTHKRKDNTVLQQTDASHEPGGRNANASIPDIAAPASFSAPTRYSKPWISGNRLVQSLNFCSARLEPEETNA